jgi:hypothetical protein
MTRAFTGARQGTSSALAGDAPGFHDPATIAKTPASQGAEAKFGSGFDRISPVKAAATMHNNLSDDAVAQSDKNVPIHPAQVPSEGSDTQESEGDGSVRDPTGQGFGT